MDKRFGLFIVLSMAILLGSFYIQTLFAPKKPADDVAEGAKDKDKDRVGDADKVGAAKDQDAVQDKGPADKDKGKDGTVDDGVKDKAEPTGAGDPPVEDPPPAEVKPVKESASQRWFTLGSLDPSAGTRQLWTFNSLGATIERVELNEHRKPDEIRYRDLEDKSGYLGHLALETATQPGGGCVVRVVGDGTPAALAGVQAPAFEQDKMVAWDVITKLNGETVADVAALHEVLGATEPGDELALTVRRHRKDGTSSELALTATLTQRPLAIIRPEPDDATDPEDQHPRSFLLSLGEIKKKSFSPFDGAMPESNWSAALIDDDGRPIAGDATPAGIEFTYPPNAGDDFQGLKIVKRFTLVETPTEESENTSFKSYHLGFDIKIVNQSDQLQSFAYQLDGPTGLPMEGWWYINKIHPTMFSSAGARDVVWGAGDGSWTLLGPSAIFKNVNKEKFSNNAFFDPDDADRDERTLRFIGVDSQYFSVNLLPAADESGDTFVFHSAVARPVVPISEDDEDERRQLDVSFRLISQTQQLQPGESFDQQFVLFAGPKDPDLLQEYGLEQTKYYGWFGIIARPLVGLLHLFYAVVRNYGIAIILLTILVRSCMMPISRKAAKNAQMMQVLQPEMKKLAEKYKNDLQKRSAAQRELFAKYNYNPFGGCLLMFLQLPVFLGLYRGLAVDTSLRDQPLIPGLDWCSDLSAPDRLWYWADAIPFSFLTGETGWLGPYLNILPLVTVALFLVQQKLFTPPATDDQTRMTQRMMTFMTLFIGLMFFKVPSGLCIYFITSSLWGIAERKLLPKPKLPERFQTGDDKDSAAKSKRPLSSKSGSNGASAATRKAKDRERQKLKQKRK